MLKRFCFLAGYMHLTDLSELNPSYFTVLHQDRRLPTTQPACNASTELTAALLEGLAEQPTALHPTGDGWNNKLNPLAPYYQASIEKKDMRTWVYSVSQMLDWNYILKVAVSVSIPSIPPSVPDENLSSTTKFLWSYYYRYRDIKYRRKFKTITDGLRTYNLTPEETQRLCHAYSVDVNRFREWYGSNLVSQNDATIVALWPFWRRKKPPRITPSSPYGGGEGPGYW